MLARPGAFGLRLALPAALLLAVPLLPLRAGAQPAAAQGPEAGAEGGAAAPGVWRSLGVEARATVIPGRLLARVLDQPGERWSAPATSLFYARTRERRHLQLEVGLGRLDEDATLRVGGRSAAVPVHLRTAHVRLLYGASFALAPSVRFDLLFGAGLVVLRGGPRPTAQQQAACAAAGASCTPADLREELPVPAALPLVDLPRLALRFRPSEALELRLDLACHGPAFSGGGALALAF